MTASSKSKSQLLRLLLQPRPQAGAVERMYRRLQERTGEEPASPERDAAYLALAKAYALFSGTPLGGAARYEQARCLWRGGEKEAA